MIKTRIAAALLAVTLPAAATMSTAANAQMMEPPPPGVIAAQDEAMERCAAQFRSFDPETGTYTSYSGETVVCPYLRSGMDDDMDQ